MARYLIYSCLGLILGGVLIEIAKKDKGYVIVSYGDTSFTSSIWFMVFVIVFSLIAFRILYSLAKKTIILILTSYSWWGISKNLSAERRTHTGFVHFIEGNWHAARRDLLKAAKVVDKPLVHYLAAARSAFELGNKEETQFLLGQAEKIAPDNELAISLSQARIHLLDNQLEPCLAILQRVKQNASEHPVVLDLLKQVYWRLKDWSALIDLLPALRAHPQISEENQRHFEKELFESYLKSLVERCYQQNMSDGDIQHSLKKAWENVPKYLKKSTDVLLCYATLMVSVQGGEWVLPLIKSHLSKEWDENLICLFGKMTSASAKEQLVLGEKWLRDRPGSAELLLALARISVRNELWGKAKEYFKSTLSLKEQAPAYAEFAALMANLGEHQQSTDLYKKGLLLLAK